MAWFIFSLIIAKFICFYVSSAQDSCVGDPYSEEPG